MELETERLRLRQWQHTDFEAYAALCADPEVMRYLGGDVMSREDAWRHLAMIAGHWSLLGFGHWAVEHKASGHCIGRVGFLQPQGWPGFELGWTIAPAYQRQGLAFEAASAALKWGFGHTDRQQIISIIHPDNRASKALAMKLGEHYLRKDVVRGISVEIYGIDRDQYLAQRHSPAER
ncbi:GNAT family N-acetyltransferase [Ferrimonas marina]|uniref:Protein N-acetyltransferase, RimJ/RimL family n=1 Tax=Ferrimonas marina TaxID=299255 RepID=A0A1M5NW37_9GAMM|nr:GNAT family N-acetyltransferase [Ferrimonas marina]SHG93389.1 Protein N-acetyltransferase, RimJ/RimL family [Ferrimonas marina]